MFDNPMWLFVLVAIAALATMLIGEALLVLAGAVLLADAVAFLIYLFKPPHD